MNIKLKYQKSPIEIISLQCPSCLNWFINDETSDIPIEYEEDIYRAKFNCPICYTIFVTSEDETSLIVKTRTKDVEADSYKKTIVWNKE